MTQSQSQIETLTQIVNSAITATAEGRQMVIKSCKELYNLIEQDVYNAGREWMLQGMYNDLCNGNFSEPFYCELKKDDFGKVVTIYNERILPNLL